MNLVELQKANEVRVYSRADNQKRTQLQAQVDNEQEYNLSYGQDAVLTILPLIEQELKEMNERRNQHTKKFYWKYVKPYQRDGILVDGRSVEQVIAAIVAINITGSLTKEATLTSAAYKMATNAFYIFNTPHEVRKEDGAHAIQFFAGMVLLIAENTDIFTIEQVNERENRLFLSEEWKEHVERSQDDYKTSVSGYEPMVCEPIDHTRLDDPEGGYLISKSPLLKHPTRGPDKKVLPAITNFTAETNPEFFAYVNRVQKTEFTVNSKLLDIINEYYFERNKFFSDFPIVPDYEEAEQEAQHSIDVRNNRNKRYADYVAQLKEEVEAGRKPMPQPKKKNGKVVEFDLNAEYKPLTPATERKAKKEYRARATEKVNKTKRLLEMAEEYALFDKMDYPVFFCGRGRLYPYSSGTLSTQGDEMAKALIQFANKKSVNTAGMGALFDTLANTLGQDKSIISVKREVAMEWFADNVNDFLEGKWDIFFDEEELFDEPITALAVCIELTELAKDPDYQSGFINHRDARVSGSSIIGTAMLDKGVMEMTSVLDWNKDGKLGDAYVEAANTAKRITEELAEKGCDVSANLLTYVDELFTRSVFKHVVMTWCSYGLTDFSLREYNKGVFNWEEELDSEHKVKFDNIMLKALAEALPACYRFLTVFKKVGAEVAKRDGYVSFTNPLSGFPVAFTERKMGKTRVEVAQPGRTIKLDIKVPTDKIDTVAITNAMAPNVIHSIDAALLFRVSHICQHYDLCFIHDSIGSHANDVETTVAAYAKTMMRIAQNDVLNNILQQLGVEDRLELVNTATKEDIISIQHSKHVLA